DGAHPARAHLPVLRQLAVRGPGHRLRGTGRAQAGSGALHSGRNSYQVFLVLPRRRRRDAPGHARLLRRAPHPGGLLGGGGRLAGAELLTDIATCAPPCGEHGSKRGRNSWTASGPTRVTSGAAAPAPSLRVRAVASPVLPASPGTPLPRPGSRPSRPGSPR